MSQYAETVIVGGGQAGLSVSYYLTRQGRPHVVLEKAMKAANAWRNHRWDSFTLNTPNWQSRLPGMRSPGADIDGFLSREEVVAYLEHYVTRFQLPVHYDVRVGSVVKKGTAPGYLVETNAGVFEAKNVVMATGLYQFPSIPEISAELPDGMNQLHSDHYRNPQSLPAGAVLVVGTGQSGAQIAEDLRQAGRRVYLSVSRAGRVPRRYRGRDANHWHQLMGDYERTVDQLRVPKEKFASKPHISGTNGGHTINLHQFVRDGMILLGRVQGVRGDDLLLARDLKENLANADKFEAEFLNRVDEFIAKTGMEAPQEILPKISDGFLAHVPAELNLRDTNITSVIWATGYGFDFNLVRLSVFDSDGYPIQRRGVTGFPGLYFVGLPWLHSAKSGLLFGLEEDAAYIASEIANSTLGPNLLRSTATALISNRSSDVQVARGVQ